MNIRNKNGSKKDKILYNQNLISIKFYNKNFKYNNECPICLEEIIVPFNFKCKHTMCRLCFEI